MMTRILIAPDSLKGSASAVEVAKAIGRGWHTVRPDDEVSLAPMADGGEGTIEAFSTAFPAATLLPVTVTGPDDRPVDTHWLLLPDRTGVIELASTSGITLLDPLRPMTAHTRGFGRAIAAAIDHGVERLLLAIGGSSSTDGGVGALTELGARFLDGQGEPIVDGGVGLAELRSVDLSGMRPLPPGGAVVLSDVTSPLTGATGAAAVFGPQKGATPADVAALDEGLARLASLVMKTGTNGMDAHSSAQLPGAGAAGGVGYGLVVWGARLSAGSSAVGDALGIPWQIAQSDLVITGEGRFDSQSMAGKVPSYLLGLADAACVPVALVAGAVQAPVDSFVAARSLSTLAGSAAAAIADPIPWLEMVGRELAGLLPDLTRTQSQAPASVT
jgi:glycerate 2-kinase